MSEFRSKVTDMNEDCLKKIPAWKIKLEEIYKKTNRESVFKGENFYFQPMFEKLCSEFSSRYDILGPIAMGGSAIVFKIHERFSDADRILKFSRPLSAEGEISKALADEGYKLRRLRHPHVIDLFETGTLEYMTPRMLGYTITEYAENGDWEKRVENDIKTIQKPEPILLNLITILYDVVKGLEYVHKNDFVHMDVKPSNVFLTSSGTAKLADLGFSKYLFERADKTTTIGFSKPYAHPNLLNYQPSGSSENRITAHLRYNQLKKIWDIYALGQSILELLSKVHNNFPDTAKHVDLFRYLHLMACRMLDGHNSEKGKFFNELAEGLPRSALEEIKYDTIKEIRIDIEKELGIFILDKEIPELNIFSRETIHGSEWKPTILTDRLKDVLYHPLVSRLSKVSQLGLVRFLYPTASHSRFDHLLGTFSNTCAYITALYNDENPLFRQILRKEDIQTLMMASLLHDLGQYPLAHDLEDLHKNFKHINYSKELLKSTVLDEKDMTLQNIIGSVNGWGVGINEIEDVLYASEIKDFSSVLQQPKIRSKLLSTIISGPIDVDKTDYLMRDSRECRLNYGFAIDFDRLLQTITINYDSKLNSFQLAVYHKGRACAESISLTRYLMFASSYWHHTSRAYKTMLQYSVKFMLDYLKEIKNEDDFWQDFKKFIITLKYTSKKKSDFLKEIEPWGVHQNIAETDLLLLYFLFDNSSIPSQDLLKMLSTRNLFKRLASLDYSSQRGESPWDLFQNISKDWPRKLELSQKLQQRLKIEIRKRAETSSSQSLSEENLTMFDDLMESPNLSVLVDIPPVKDIEQPLRFVKEMMEDRNHDIPSDRMSQLSEAWTSGIDNLFRGISTVRIFCHPSIRDTIKAALTYEEIETMAREELSKIN